MNIDQETRPAATWQTCDDPDTCHRPHWLAVGYRDGTLTAVTLHESTPTVVRTPTQQRRSP